MNEKLRLTINLFWMRRPWARKRGGDQLHPGAYLEFQFGGGSSPEFFSKFDPLKIFLVEFRPLSRKIRKILVIFFILFNIMVNFYIYSQQIL